MRRDGHLRRRPEQTHDLVGLGDVLKRVPAPKILIADRAYDAQKLTERGCEVVTPSNPTRKHPPAWERKLYRARNLIERMLCRLEDFRRIACR
jgi:transposase